jgi:hypothetical protein
MVSVSYKNEEKFQIYIAMFNIPKQKCEKETVDYTDKKANNVLKMRNDGIKCLRDYS